MLFAISVASIYISLNYFSGWHVWGVQSYCILFPDLHVLLCSIDAHFAGYNAFVENPFCKWNIPHVYSRLWFFFHYIGFSDSNRTFIGLSLLIIFISATGTILSKNKVYGLFFIMSPAFLLAIERCNNDLIIFTLLLFPILKIRDRSLIITIVSHLILIFCIALKYYPIASSVIFFFRDETFKKKLIHISIQSTFFISWIVYVRSDLILQKDFIPNPGYAWSFGFDLLNSLTKNLLNIDKHIAYYSLGTLTIAYLYYACSKIHNLQLVQDSLLIKPFYFDMYVAGSSILCFCYFVKTSFDHRMIYFIFCIPLLLVFHKNNSYKVPILFSPLLLVISFIVSSWHEFIREWCVYFLKEFQMVDHVPLFLFGLRSLEILFNHFIFTTLLAFLICLLLNTFISSKRFNYKLNFKIFSKK